jgi:hypothetical protein
MSSEPESSGTATGGIGGSLRAIAAACVLVLAAIGVLMVLELVPRSAFADVGGKVLGVAGIALVTAVALGLLARR